MYFYTNVVGTLHLPIAFGDLSKKRVPEDQFQSWLEPLRRDRKVRRDFDKYLRSVPTRTQLLDWSEQQRAFKGQVLVVVAVLRSREHLCWSHARSESAARTDSQSTGDILNASVVPTTSNSQSR